MPDQVQPRSWLAGALHAGRHGNRTSAAVTLREVPLAIVQITARQASGAQPGTPSASFSLASLHAAGEATSIVLPPAGRAAAGGEIDALAIAPGTWLVTAPRDREDALVGGIAAAAGDRAAVVVQTWGKVALRIAGPAARDVLRKACRVDLHPRVFGPGHVAVTSLAHIGAIVHQRDEAPTYDLLVPATLAETFLEWLLASAAEFGCEVQG